MLGEWIKMAEIKVNVKKELILKDEKRSKNLINELIRYQKDIKRRNNNSNFRDVFCLHFTIDWFSELFFLSISDCYQFSSI